MRVPRRPLRAIALALLALYAAGLAAVSLWPSSTQEPAAAPIFRATKRNGGTAADALHVLNLLDLFGNVALYLPLGMLLVLALRGRRLLLTCLVPVAVSAALEATQYRWLPARDGSLRDVVTNSCGGLLGVALGHALLWVQRRIGRARAAKAPADQAATARPAGPGR